MQLTEILTMINAFISTAIVVWLFYKERKEKYLGLLKQEYFIAHLEVLRAGKDFAHNSYFLKNWKEKSPFFEKSIQSAEHFSDLIRKYDDFLNRDVVRASQNLIRTCLLKDSMEKDIEKARDKFIEVMQEALSIHRIEKYSEITKINKEIEEDIHASKERKV